MLKGAVYLSDIKITLPGSETVTLTGQSIDKLIRAGDGDAALLYLYILKTHGQKSSSEAADALNKSKGWIASAMAILSRLGLIQLDGEAQLDGDSARGADKEPREYTDFEVKQEIISGSDFAIVVDETQRRLGKQLTEDDMMRLFGIYDSLRLPAEVILQLITHCINESRKTGDGRAPNVRYIEKAAYTWERKGIFTLERAEEYLKELEERKSVRGEIKKILQIRDRELSETQKRYVDGWIDMGFEPGAIAIAYDRAMVKTNGTNLLSYMDGIMKNWHNKEMHTAEQIQKMDSGTHKNGAGLVASQKGWQNAKQGTQKHGEPNREDLERMQRLLSKIKEDS